MDRRRFVYKLVLAAAVVGMMGAIAYVQIADRRCRLRRTHTRLRMHDFQEVLVHYGVDHADRCPRSMRVLVDHGYLRWPLVDDWGTPLAFTCTSPFSTDEPLIVSAGPDRRFGTSDDVRSGR